MYKCQIGRGDGQGDAIPITQHFHVDRVLYIRDELGIDAVSVAVDCRSYAAGRFWWWRKAAATTRAWLDHNLLQLPAGVSDPSP